MTEKKRKLMARHGTGAKASITAEERYTTECTLLTRRAIMTNEERSKTKETPRNTLANAQKLHLHQNLNLRPRSSPYQTSLEPH